MAEESEWKQIALYLADCHAATAEHEGTLKRTSKSSRKRFQSICELAAAMLEDGRFNHYRCNDVLVIQRLRDACKSLEDS